MKIGHLKFEKRPVFLAPMEDVSDPPFRLLCKELGADLVFTEFVSSGGLVYEADPALIQGDMQTIRNLMWHYVGLVRSEYRLHRALRELRHLWIEIEDFYRKTRLSDGLIGLRNAVQVAMLVAQAARQNPHSLGCHYRDDSKPPGTGGPPQQNDQLEPAEGPR